MNLILVLGMSMCVDVVLGACVCESLPLVFWCRTHVSVYGKCRGQRQHRVMVCTREPAGSRVCAGGAELLIDVSARAMGIACPMSRVQQGGSQAVKTDSGLLPEFHLHMQLSRTFIYIIYGIWICDMAIWI